MGPLLVGDSTFDARRRYVFTRSIGSSADFLTSADKIVPAGALTIRLDESTGITTVRNLLYPGFVGFTAAGTKTWGYCYCGTGEKNLDIAFMLP